ncbi:hypothetical protein KC959_04310 [Candidatus Saccharibacteria bacterium]|nr:hypothetical protein [Candidatus Saccharibacteria bacterium]
MKRLNKILGLGEPVERVTTLPGSVVSPIKCDMWGTDDADPATRAASIGRLVRICAEDESGLAATLSAISIGRTSATG